jgi:insertion element IS1 protein InsB
MYKRLKKQEVEIYCCDDYPVYIKEIPKEKRLIGKEFTHRIEGNNSDARHWFARFRRKSKVVSKSVEMVDLTMALFAKFHVNEGLSSLLLPTASLFN